MFESTPGHQIKQIHIFYRLDNHQEYHYTLAMDTQALQAFIAVTETRSFSEAAERLYITQPAVSKRIAVLEQQLNCRLFDRISRSVTLTEAGQALLPNAMRILQAVSDAELSIRELSGVVSGTLSIGISHHIGLHRLPPVLQAFTERYPKVQLDIDFMDSEEAHEQIMHGKLELAVVTLAPDGNTPLVHETVWTDELLVTVAPNHPLAIFDAADLSTLSQFPAILPGLNTYTGQIIKKLFKDHNLKLDVSMATNYLETIKMMVSIGLGWSVLPKTMVDDSIKGLDISDLRLHRALGYVHHRERTLSNAGRAFVEILKEYA